MSVNGEKAARCYGIGRPATARQEHIAEIGERQRTQRMPHAHRGDAEIVRRKQAQTNPPGHTLRDISFCRNYYLVSFLFGAKKRQTR